MNNITDFLTEAMMKPSAAKADAVLDRIYSGAIGFIEGKGTMPGVIIGKPFAFDDNSGQEVAATQVSRDFPIKVDYNSLISAIDKNKKNVYDVVLKGDKYKNMMYVYFVPNKSNEAYCCLYSDINVNLKGNYAFVISKV